MLEQIQQERFCKARREAIAMDFMNLNPEQRKSALATEGPLLLLAGAGSGKTTVLIHRIANLIRYGRGSDSEEMPPWVTEDDVEFLEQYVQNPTPESRLRQRQLCTLEPPAPWRIIAITFTNKAAGELKNRLQAMLGEESLNIWASTFHSACVRILRRDIDKLGFDRSFNIYDTDDSLRVVKDALKEMNLNDKVFPPRSVLSEISKAKDAGQLAEEFMAECQADGDVRMLKIARIYQFYEKRLWNANALDFDDLILHTVRLLEQCQQVREYYQNQFRYVLIDEYQDTNQLQYRLASLLAGKWKNICVVGDDDQSIYRFRGATIKNILSFEKQFPGARVFRLEQNYRSTSNILRASNEVIRHNTARKGKQLWTEKGDGDKIRVHTAMNENDEAAYVAGQILEGYRQGHPWTDFAILYRMNAQSNQMEMAMKRNGIPYRVIGGIRFFERAEVKDMLAYLCLIHNPEDDLRMRRIINTPTRGNGQTTIDRLQVLATEHGVPLWQILLHADAYPEVAKAVPKLQKFVQLITDLQSRAKEIPLTEFYQELLDRTGYIQALQEKKLFENRTKIENVQELKTSIAGYQEGQEEQESQATLDGFLDEIALYTDLDDQKDGENCIVMMTMHSAKGLEFPVVFVVGAEEGIFPGYRAIGDQDETEEERRLCYVAMTRAKERLYITCAAQRMLFGRTNANLPSRFVEEIPPELVEQTGFGRVEKIEDESLPWDEDDSPPWEETGKTKSVRSAQTGSRTSYGSGTQSRKAHEGRHEQGRGNGRKKPSGTSAIYQARGPVPELHKGDMVTHKAFGRGMVLSVQKTGGDALLEVAFDQVGTKRLMLNSAAQYITKE